MTSSDTIRENISEERNHTITMTNAQRVRERVRDRERETEREREVINKSKVVLLRRMYTRTPDV
jgi:hypothetical protein